MKKFFVVLFFLLVFRAEATDRLPEEQDKLIYLYTVDYKGEIPGFDVYLDTSTIYKDGYIITWGERYVYTEHGRAFMFDLINNEHHSKKEIEDFKNEAFSIYYHLIAICLIHLWRNLTIVAH